MLNVACISFSLGKAAAKSGVVTSRQATLVATSNSTRGGVASAGDAASKNRAATARPVIKALSRTRSNRQERYMERSPSRKRKSFAAARQRDVVLARGATWREI